MSLDSIITKHVLKNAFDYGKPNAGSIVGKVIGEDPDCKKERKTTMAKINAEVARVSKLTKAQIESEMSKFEYVQKKEEEKERSKVPIHSILKKKVTFNLDPPLQKTFLNGQKSSPKIEQNKTPIGSSPIPVRVIKINN